MRDALAYRLDDARALHAQIQRHRQRIDAAALVDVDEVDAAGLMPDANLTGARLAHLDIDQLHQFRAAGGFDADRFFDAHHVTPNLLELGAILDHDPAFRTASKYALSKRWKAARVCHLFRRAVFRAPWEPPSGTFARACKACRVTSSSGEAAQDPLRAGASWAAAPWLR